MNFTAPAAWTASVEATKAVDWLTVEPSSGSAGSVEMKVTAQPNKTYEDRSATVTIKSGEASASFTVKQAGKPRPVEVTEVKLDKVELSLTEGESVTLVATVAPNDATDKTVSWSSDNTAVATVDDSGKVTAVAGGEATITAKAGEKTATCKVTVTAKVAPQPQPTPEPTPEPPAVVPVSSISLDQTTLSLQPGGSATLTSTVGPDNATDKTVTWNSSNPAVATVDASGKVTAVAVGEAVITAQAGDKTAECKVTVLPIPVSSVTLNKTELELKIGDSETLVATVGPDNATDKSVTWSSSNASVATVDQNGKITAIAVGEASITAKAGEKTAECLVKILPEAVQPGQNEGIGYGDEITSTPNQPVIIPVESITLDTVTQELRVGESVTLVATVGPDNATDKTVNWSSSDGNVAKVEGSGIITGLSVGEATITAKAGEKTAECKVIVKAKDVQPGQNEGIGYGKDI